MPNIPSSIDQDEIEIRKHAEQIHRRSASLLVEMGLSPYQSISDQIEIKRKSSYSVAVDTLLEAEVRKSPDPELNIKSKAPKRRR